MNLSTSLPWYVHGVFVLTTVVTVLVFYLAAQRNRVVLALAALIMALQAVLTAVGFYDHSEALPPRVGLMILPSMLLMLYGLFSSNGRAFVASLDLRRYTLLHVVRVPVEVTIFWLFVHGLMPESMTFEGRNWDILSGLTAPLIALIGWNDGKPRRKLLIIWHIVCLLLVLQVVGTGILSAPSPFQQLSFDQPNRAVLQWPFVWLPSVIVPIVLFGHIAALRRLLAD